MGMNNITILEVFCRVENLLQLAIALSVKRKQRRKRGGGGAERDGEKETGRRMIGEARNVF